MDETQREVSREVPQGSVTTLFLLITMTQVGTGGRVITFEDDTRLGAMVRAYHRQTEALNVSQQSE